MSGLINLAIVLFIGLSAAFAQIAGGLPTWGLVWLCFFGWFTHTLVNFIQEYFEIEIDDDDENHPI